MILFDGSQNYELGALSLLLKVNTTPRVVLSLFKDTSVTERLGSIGEPTIVRCGRDYDIPGLHDKIMEIDIKSVGRFTVHAMDPQSRKNIDSLHRMCMDYPKAELMLSVKLRGDCVPAEPGMEHFEVKVLAQPGNWSGFDFARPQFR